MVTTPDGDLLDIAFKDFPPEGEPLTTAIKPLWPVKVLFDESGGVLDKVLKINEEALKQGPLFLYKKGILRRYAILLRRQSKIEKHKEDKEFQLIFSADVMELPIRLWFELQNEWALPADKAIVIMEEKDPEFRKVLGDLCEDDTVKRIRASQQLIEKIKNMLQKAF